jgi:uncharacterized membrane protein YhfC
MEAIILGWLVGLTFVNMVVLRGMDLKTLNLTADLLTKTQNDLAVYWSAPWYLAFLGAAERLFALTIQVSLAVLVLQVFTRHDWRWLVVATGYHLIVDATSVVGVYSKWPPLLIEATLVPFVLVSLGIIFGLRPRGEPLIPPEPAPALMAGATDSPRIGARREADIHRQIDDSRFA